MTPDSTEPHPSLFSPDAYDFHLPEELIAQAPVSPRDSSRLLVVHRSDGRIEHRRFSDLPEYLDASDLIVANNSKVIPARLLGFRLLQQGDGEVRGGKVEFLMLEQVGPLEWEGMFHASAKHKPGVRFEIPVPIKGPHLPEPLIGELVRGASDSPSGTVVARFNRDPVTSGAGRMPLPPYIGRDVRPGDDEAEYQTVYAKEAGSAAAPTAGLHFTDGLRARLADKGVAWREVTLHVGLGTFRPVKATDVREHVMHEERFEVGEDTALEINARKRGGGRIVAVGTTAVRTLESAYDPATSAVQPGVRRTSLFIHPGKGGAEQFRVVDRLITNFHLPKSTLLMLVSAFAGRELMLAAYNEAVRQKYRFFSYGDAMLIL